MGQCISTEIATCITRSLIKKQKSITLPKTILLVPLPVTTSWGSTDLITFQFYTEKIIQCKPSAYVVSLTLHGFLVKVCSCYQSSCSSLITTANGIPLCDSIIMYLAILLLMAIWVVSI